MLQDFDDFLAVTVAETVELSSDVIDLTTEIRAQYGFKLQMLLTWPPLYFQLRYLPDQ